MFSDLEKYIEDKYPIKEQQFFNSYLVHKDEHKQKEMNLKNILSKNWLELEFLICQTFELCEIAIRRNIRAFNFIKSDEMKLKCLGVVLSLDMNILKFLDFEKYPELYADFDIKQKIMCNIIVSPNEINMSEDEKKQLYMYIIDEIASHFYIYESEKYTYKKIITDPIYLNQNAFCVSERINPIYFDENTFCVPECIKQVFNDKNMDDIRFYALQKSDLFIDYIEQTEEFIKELTQMIKYFDNKQQLFNLTTLFKKIKNKTPELCERIIEVFPHCVGYIENRTEDLCLRALDIYIEVNKKEIVNLKEQINDEMNDKIKEEKFCEKNQPFDIYGNIFPISDMGIHRYSLKDFEDNSTFFFDNSTKKWTLKIFAKNLENYDKQKRAYFCSEIRENFTKMWTVKIFSKILDSFEKQENVYFSREMKDNFNKLNDEDICILLRKNPFIIKFVNEQKEIFCDIAIETNMNTFEFINNKNKYMTLAIKHDPFNIKFCEDQTDELRNLAFDVAREKNMIYKIIKKIHMMYNSEFIYTPKICVLPNEETLFSEFNASKNSVFPNEIYEPMKKDKEMIIEIKEYLIEHFNVKTPYFISETLKNDPNFILKYTNYQTLDNWKIALSINGKLINYVNKNLLCDELYCIAIKQNPEVFHKIKMKSIKLIKLYEEKLLEKINE